MNFLYALNHTINSMKPRFLLISFMVVLLNIFNPNYCLLPNYVGASSAVNSLYKYENLALANLQEKPNLPSNFSDPLQTLPRNAIYYNLENLEKFKRKQKVNSLKELIDFL